MVNHIIFWKGPPKNFHTLKILFLKQFFSFLYAYWIYPLSTRLTSDLSYLFFFISILVSLVFPPAWAILSNAVSHHHLFFFFLVIFILQIFTPVLNHFLHSTLWLLNLPAYGQAQACQPYIQHIKNPHNSTLKHCIFFPRILPEKNFTLLWQPGKLGLGTAGPRSQSYK